MVLSTGMNFLSPSPPLPSEIKGAPSSQSPCLPVRRRLNFLLPIALFERTSRRPQETPPHERLDYSYIPISSESSDSEDAGVNTLSTSVSYARHVVDKEESTSATDSDRGYEIKREGRFTASLSKVKSLGNRLHSSQPFDVHNFVKEQTSEFFERAFQTLLKQDSVWLTRLFNLKPSFAVDALICFYYYEKKIIGKKKKKLEKFLIEECLERVRDIPLNKRCALFQFLYAITNPFHTSIYALGMCYAVGFGTHRSMVKAAAAFHLAAKRGDYQAQFILGGICEFINADYVQAVRWYKEAHNGGLPAATFALACCYSSGIGVSTSLDKAFDLCRRAVHKKVLGAPFLQSILYREGPDSKKDVEKSLKWCFKGIKYGEADYQAIYGMFSTLENADYQAIYGMFSTLENFEFSKNEENFLKLEKRICLAKKRLRVVRCVGFSPFGKAQKKYWENKKKSPQEIGAQQNEQRRQFFLKNLMGLDRDQKYDPITIT